MKIMAKWTPPLTEAMPVKPVTGSEERQVQRSSTYIIKPGFDVAHRNAIPPHLSEMNQEAVLPAQAAGGEQQQQLMLH